MTELKVEMSAAAVQPLVEAAILRAIDGEMRERLVQQAVNNLLAEKRDYNGRALGTPLGEAFKSAVESAATRLVHESIESDPKVREAIQSLVSPMIVDMCNGNYDGLPEAIGKGFTAWLRDQQGRYA